MAKRIWKGMSAAILAGMVMMTACAAGSFWEEDPHIHKGQEDQTIVGHHAEEAEETWKGQEPQKERAIHKEEKTQEDQEDPGGQGSREESFSWPRVAALSGDMWISGVMNSEGCYCIYDGHSFGYMTETGEEITPFIYEEATAFSEGLACVYMDGKYGYIGKNGETVLPFVYDQASPFSEGLAYFCMGGEYGFMNREGEVVLQLDCDSVSSFKEGRAYFSVDGRYGYVDQNGRILVEPVYEDAGYFRHGRAVVAKEGRYGVIGTEGEEIIAPEYDWIEVHEDYIFAEREGYPVCFDWSGERCLQGAWEDIRVWDGGLFTVKKNGRFGLADRQERILLEPEYDAVYPIPGKEMAIVKKEDLFGVLDFQGNERVPFLYHWMTYEARDTKEGLQVMCKIPLEEGEDGKGYQEKYGYLAWQDATASDMAGHTGAGGEEGRKTYSIEPEGAYRMTIPVNYDFLSSFVNGRAVAGLGGKYGIIREDGVLEYPIQYDLAEVFEDGSLAVGTGNGIELRSWDGTLLHTGHYDAISAMGEGYRVEKDGKYGFLDSRGKLVVPLIYDSCTYLADNLCRMSRHGTGTRKILVKTQDGQERVWSGAEDVLFQNQITPRVKEYAEFTRNVLISTEGGDYHTDMEELRSYRRFSKLYRMEGSGGLLLYFYAEPYEQMTFPMSHSGFFLLENGQVKELVTGYECGGSMRGGYICFWYDTAKSVQKPGTRGSWGGFGGYAYSGYIVHALRDNGVAEFTSIYRVDQTSGNYGKEELLEHAGLFYDGEGNPYTEESILQAGTVTAYEVDGERTTKEHYEEVSSRYLYRNALDAF